MFFSSYELACASSIVKFELFYDRKEGLQQRTTTKNERLIRCQRKNGEFVQQFVTHWMMFSREKDGESNEKKIFDLINDVCDYRRAKIRRVIA